MMALKKFLAWLGLGTKPPLETPSPVASPAGVTSLLAFDENLGVKSPVPFDENLLTSDRKEYGLFYLHLPSRNEYEEGQLVANNGVTVIVGANGSGKTRLGAWIEFNSAHKASVYRISAQKSLDIPDLVKTTDMETAELSLYYGGSDKPSYDDWIQQKMFYRWKRRPVTSSLNDFESLVTYLFSEENQKNMEYRRAVQIAIEPLSPPRTKLDITKNIWEYILSNRELIVGTNNILARARFNAKSDNYKASDMSDGERVVFYLIGACLAAPKDSVLVIDEPELHLHKAIQNQLWNAIEAQRQDCQFVYLTHDLDFAASRADAVKVSLREYDGKYWDWYITPAQTDIEEDVLLLIAGSRKPILFIEGTNDSLDFQMYSRIYRDFTVIPLGSCSHVIHATNSFGYLKNLHLLDCYGIIDRDHRSSDEIANLRLRSIYSLEFPEIENVFLHPDIIMYMSSRLARTDSEEILTDVSKIVFERLKKDRTKLALDMTIKVIERQLQNFGSKAKEPKDVKNALDNLVENIDVDAIYHNFLSQIDETINIENYVEAIKLYNNKGLVTDVSQCFDLKPNGYIQYIKRFLLNEQDKPLVDIIRKLLPDIESPSPKSRK